MRGGDISNEVPRSALIALDAIATELPGKESWLGSRRFRKAVTTPGQQAARWVFDPLAIGRLWRTYYHHNLRMDLVVFGEDEEFAQAIQARAEKFNYPVASTWAYPTRYMLAANLANLPHVYGVIDDPQHALVYGGRYMTWEEVA